jgi:hypothetical protein
MTTANRSEGELAERLRSELWFWSGARIWTPERVAGRLAPGFHSTGNAALHREAWLAN